MKLTILGCGGSVGVPSVSCTCSVCSSPDKRNKRLRTSALIENNKTRILIDTGPDLREQALTNNISQVDAVLYTHAHADHINGIDDLRAFKPADKDNNSIPIYGDEITLTKLKKRSPYMFVSQLPETPWNKSFLIDNTVDYYEEIKISDTSIFFFPQQHGETISLGMIFNNKIAYCTDVKELPDKALHRLDGMEVLVIECLGYRETLAHAHFERTLEYIKNIKPKIAIFTHMSHEIEFHTITQQVGEYKKKYKIEANIVVPYDGYYIKI